MDGKQKVAYAQIEVNLAQVDKLLRECEQLAEENAVEFHWTTPNDTSLDYIPESKPRNVEDEDEGWYSSLSGWVSSSDYC